MKKRFTIVAASLLALSSVAMFSSTNTKVQASSGSDIVKEAEKDIGKYNYSFAPSIRDTGNHKSASFLVKKYHLKKYTIPKKFRGTWYGKKAYVKVTAHGVSGNREFKTTKGLPIYYGTEKTSEKISNKYGMQTSLLLASPYQKHSMNFTFIGSQAFGITRLTNYGHQALMVESPHNVYYRSRKLARKLSPSVQHKIQF